MQIVNLSDVQSKVQEFILEDVMPLPKNTVAMLSSPGGVAKTWLGLRVAMKYTFDTEENVLLWMSEDEPEFIKDRADKLTQFADVESIPRNVKIVVDEPPQLAFKENGIFKANYEAFLEVRQTCAEHGVTFIVIDPLLAFYGGSENDNAQARVFMQPFLAWAKQDGVTILLIHHAKKDGTGTRGASAFVDATRTVYELDFVRIPDGDAMIKDNISTDAGLRQLTLTKDNRYAQGILKTSGRETSYQVAVTPEFKAIR